MKSLDPGLSKDRSQNLEVAPCAITFSKNLGRLPEFSSTINNTQTVVASLPLYV